MTDAVNLWSEPEHATQYLQRADTMPHRVAGEQALLEWLSDQPPRVLDLGSGDGRLLGLVRTACEPREAVVLDFSPAMLERLRERFGNDPAVRVIEHDLERPLPDLGAFDAIVSSFAIHHLGDERKRTLYREIFDRLVPGGVFCNLEHVASPTPELHLEFLTRLDVRPEDDDPSNKLLDVETQLAWLRDIGFVDVDCHWKWRELTLLAGRRPVTGTV
ncbi:MAG: methyltransferase [Acidobacteria bacterium SCN 69-37]|nr:MAG: methyltransferase [Acidobacteria bacterium SCN 69-37]